MILLRLLGIGAIYGVGFMFVKSLFPEPFVLLILQGGQSSEGNLTTLALVYMGVGLLSGLISGILTLLVYATGVLPSGGVLDPFRLIGNSVHPPGVPLLVAWTIARDLLPAGLAGLFLSPVAGGPLQRLYAADRPPAQKHYEWEE